MEKLTSLLFLLCCGLCFGQHTGPGPCHLEQDNKEWIEQFKKADSLDIKIDMVMNKLLADSDYFFYNPAPTNLDDRSSFGPIPCTHKCTIRFGIVYGKREGMVLDLTKNPELEDVLYELVPENIDYIDLNEYEENDIYQHVTDKRSGVVIHTENSEVRRMIRNVIKRKGKKKVKEDPDESEN
ncbi:MAG: hypothetical protein AAFP76_00905 [Bacteroidota bacterium]